MFQAANKEIDEFAALNCLIPQPEKLEKRRVYWKDVIEEEEKKMETVVAEQQLERLKLDKEGGNKPPEDKKEIGSLNPIADFRKMLSDRKEDLVEEAMSQMSQVIRRMVVSSMDGDLYDKAMECLLVMRQGSVDEDDVDDFNNLCKFIKSKHAAFFDLMKEQKITLISKAESRLGSKVTEQEAEQFLTVSRVIAANRDDSAEPQPKDKLDEIE